MSFYVFKWWKLYVFVDFNDSIIKWNELRRYLDDSLWSDLKRIWNAKCSKDKMQSSIKEEIFDSFDTFCILAISWVRNIGLKWFLSHFEYNT